MAWSGTRFTARGLSLLVLGGLASAAAAYIGERDLLWITLSVALLPVAALAYLLLVRPRLG